MTRRISPRVAPILMSLLLGLASPMLACEKSGSEKAVDKARDALDLREHEKLRDAGEDLKSAVEGAGGAIKDEAEALKQKANQAIND